jgi:hypothetical protein
MKNIVRSLMTMLAILSLLAPLSCQKPDSITASKAELSWTKDGGKKTLDITANCAWTISAPDWITCEPSEGTGNMQVSVRAVKNDHLERKDVLTISGGTAVAQVNLTQSGVDFTASQMVFDFDAAGKPIKFTIESNYDWSIEIPQAASWITASPSSGTAGTTEVTLTPAPIVDRVPRERTFLTVNYGKSFTMLTVSQAMPNDAPGKPELVSPEDGAKDVKVSVVFSWKEVQDPDGDAVSYRLLISKDGGESWGNVPTKETSTKYTDLLEKSTDYIWKVEAVDAFGAKTESDTRSFTTGDGGAYKDGEVSTYQVESAGASKPVHLVFMGDGFIEEDYQEGGAFDQAVETAVEALFNVEPYATYRNYFRVSTVAVYSQERGATILKDMSSVKTQTRNTAFNSTLEGGNSTATSCNYDKVYSYAVKVPGVNETVLENTTVFLLINVDAYAGTCAMELRGRSVSMCPMGRDSFKPVVIHEGGGHGFGRLLDEYRYTEAKLPEDVKDQITYWRGYDPYYGYNIDLTGDKTKVHWSHFFSRSGYEAVGLYEGACLYTQGVWRPEEISCMHDNRAYYNAPSREAIVRRIMKASGSTFNMNDFVAKDKVKKDPTTKAYNYVEDFTPFAPPVLIDRL